MAAGEIHVGDIGTAFTATVKDESGAIVNLSDALELTLIFSKPNNIKIPPKTAVFVTDGTDGKIRYVTIAGDLDIPGKWKVQAKVVKPSGSWSSDNYSFDVYPNL